jgi:hypothetical protein
MTHNITHHRAENRVSIEPQLTVAQMEQVRQILNCQRVNSLRPPVNRTDFYRRGISHDELQRIQNYLSGLAL